MMISTSRNGRALAFASLTLTFLPMLASAGTITIAANPSAPNGNFQAPGSSATVGYSIQTSDDGTNFDVLLTTSDASALPFANLYFDTIASTPNTGSNLGFEFGQTTADAFDPSTSVKYSIAGSGVSAVFTTTNGVTTASIVIPNSFFLTNPEGMAFTPTPAGTLVSLHLSQSFGYSVVGGSANFPAPVELGDAIVGTSATPEPQSSMLVGIGAGALIVLRRKFTTSDFRARSGLI